MEGGEVDKRIQKIPRPTPSRVSRRVERWRKKRERERLDEGGRGELNVREDVIANSQTAEQREWAVALT